MREPAIMAKAHEKPAAVSVDAKKYGALLAQILPAIIETEEQNEHYLAIVEKLMMRDEDDLSPEENKLLDLLIHLIEDFEKRFYQPEGATPLQVLTFLMETNGLKQADLVPIFGSKGIVSEVVNGKRQISKAMAKALGEFFNISPAAFI
jgi:HTH-type transcriptional regulator / antitoxin HigA